MFLARYWGLGRNFPFGHSTIIRARRGNCENICIQTIPSFAIVPAFAALGFGKTPGLEINLANVLHGEQYVKIHKAFDPDGGKLVTTSRIGDMLDKGRDPRTGKSQTK